MFFNLGGAEILVIAMVALIAVGPEQLPGVLRKVGRFMGQARSMTTGLRDEFMSGIDEVKDIADPKQWMGSGSDDDPIVPRAYAKSKDKAGSDGDDADTEPETDPEPTADADADADLEPTAAVDGDESEAEPESEAGPETGSSDVEPGPANAPGGSDNGVGANGAAGTTTTGETEDQV